MANILVVDDRPSNRQFLVTLLGYGGHSLHEAADGAEALKQVRTQRPDLVITDILMPNMDGYEFVQRLRADPTIAATPVIFYTASYSAPQAKALGKSCGVHKVLAKPAEPQVILAAVNDVLGIAPQPLLADPAAVRAPVSLTRPVDDSMNLYLRDLEEVRARFEDVVAGSVKLGAERDAVKELSKKFADNVAAMQRVTTRLSALLEVGMEMMTERDPARLVELFFAAACDLISSKYAAVGMLDEGERSVHIVFAKGFAPAIIQAGGPRTGLLGSILSGERVLRARRTAAAGDAEGLPRGHPPVHDLLGIPVSATGRVYGWMYFADSASGKGFSDEDTRVATVMTRKLALLYENAMLYDEIQRHAAQLQIEIGERRRTQEELAASETRFRQMAENIQDVFFLQNLDSTEIYYVSPAYEKIWGRSCESLYNSPASWSKSIHPDDLAYAFANFSEGRSTGFDYEFRILRPDGEVRWIHARGFPIMDAAGTPYRTAGVAADITERKHAEIRIRRLNRVYAVLSGINTLIVRVRDRDELFREACQVAVKDGEFRMAWIGLVDPASGQVKPVAWDGDVRDFFESTPWTVAQPSARKQGFAWRAMTEKRPAISNDIRSDPHTAMKKECAERGINSLVMLPLVLDDESIGVLALYAAEAGFFDEEEMKLLNELAGDISFALAHLRNAEKLNYLAYYDELTGLANRAHFHERLDQMVRLAGRGGQKLAVLVLDIDRFKSVNDSLGRDAGDELLRQVAQRMRGVATDPSTLARVSADRFAIVRIVASEDEVARHNALKLEQCFGSPFRVANIEVSISAKVGIALFPNDGQGADELFRNAEAALKKAKEAGERSLFYTQEMTARVAGNLAMENKLRQAIAKEEFVLFYQPKVNLEDRRVVGVEALIRWRDPERGLVPPLQFIPLLEETGMILQVGAWALRRAVLDHRHWLRQGLKAPRIAVNVSQIQLRQPDFVEVVAEAAAQGANPTGLDLEITESLLMDDVQGNVRKLAAIRESGVNIAIDDFGTGYSSLSYLSKLPVHALKIDRSFIVAMLEDAAAMTLVQTIISLAHALRLKVIAEGVETEDQAKMLRLLRCDEMQGYLISKPRPIEEITPLLREPAK